MTTARAVREHVARIPTRSFVSGNDLLGPRHAVACELARLADRDELVRVYKGLYWKGPTTRAGMPPPPPMTVGLEIAGSGSGPAEFSAAAALGLTTQVPSTEVVAVAGRPPRPPQGVAYVSRSFERRIRGLRPFEVAVIELLRDGTRFIEADWEHAEAAVAQLAERGHIRLRTISEQVEDEHHVAARTRWQHLWKQIRA